MSLTVPYRTHCLLVYPLPCPSPAPPLPLPCPSPAPAGHQREGQQREPRLRICQLRPPNLCNRGHAAHEPAGGCWWEGGRLDGWGRRGSTWCGCSCSVVMPAAGLSACWLLRLASFDAVLPAHPSPLPLPGVPAPRPCRCCLGPLLGSASRLPPQRGTEQPERHSTAQQEGERESTRERPACCP